MNLSLNKIEVYNKAINHLPEIEASKIGVAISEKELDIVKSAYLPTLSLSGNIGSGYTSAMKNTFFIIVSILSLSIIEILKKN